MKKTKFILMVFIATFLISCDCLVHIQGVVIDSKTRLPIDSVLVIDNVYCATCEREDIYTDSLGIFEYNSMVGGLFCPKSSLTFEKEGYKKRTKKYRSYYRNDIVTVVLKRKKSRR